MVLTVIAFSVLVPINVTGNNLSKTTNSTNPTGLDILSLSNVPAGSKLLWAHVITVFVFTFICWYFLYKIYEQYVELTSNHKSLDNIQTRTVMVTHLPKDLRTDEQLLNYFKKFYGESVVYAAMIPDIQQLESLRNKREQFVKDYQRSVDINIESGQRKSVFMYDVSHTSLHNSVSSSFGVNLSDTISFCCCLGKKTLAIDYYKRRIKDLDESIIMEQKRYFEGASKPRMSHVGFVTFNSTLNAMLCQQALHNKNPNAIIVKPAPDPRDLRWNSIVLRKEEKHIRRVVTAVVLLLLFIFWSIPVTFISAFTNLETLSKVQWLDSLVRAVSKNALVYNWLEGFLPSLSLVIFMAILPYLLRFIIKWSGSFVLKDQELELLRLYWVFLLLNVFILFTITGSLFAILNELIETPTEVVKLLAKSVPQQAIFFTNYIVVQCLVIYALFFVTRLPDYLLCKLKQWFLVKTAKENLEAQQPDPYWFDYAFQYARESLVFSIALTYSTISPIILPFAFLFFVIAYFSAKHNFIFVHTPRYEGVRMCGTVVDFGFASLILYQLTSFGALGLSLFPYASSIFALVIGTGLFRYYLLSRFARPSKFLALEHCPSTPEKQINYMHLNNTYIYMHPALQPLVPFTNHEAEVSDLSSLIVNQ